MLAVATDCQQLQQWNSARASDTFFWRPFPLDDSEFLPERWQGFVAGARFFGMFIAPKMVWRRDYVQLVATVALPSGMICRI